MPVSPIPDIAADTLLCVAISVRPNAAIDAKMPMEYVNDDCMLVLSWNGKPLEPKHGGPIRAFIPTLYGWKSTKWLDGIEVMEKDRPGFWEQRGYNMRGDYWKEERYWEGLNFVDKLLSVGRKKL